LNGKEPTLKIEHRLEIKAICPVDGLPDVYLCTVRTSRVLPVEQILKVARRLERRAMYQEDLTLALHRSLAAEVETIGSHSGVETRVLCGG
jgi:GTP cyclohydrolase I